MCGPTRRQTQVERIGRCVVEHRPFVARSITPTRSTLEIRQSIGRWLFVVTRNVGVGDLGRSVTRGPARRIAPSAYSVLAKVGAMLRSRLRGSRGRRIRAPMRDGCPESGGLRRVASDDTGTLARSFAKCARAMMSSRARSDAKVIRRPHVDALRWRARPRSLRAVGSDFSGRERRSRYSRCPAVHQRCGICRRNDCEASRRADDLPFDHRADAHTGSYFRPVSQPARLRF
jgi:hypothetical protein